MRIRPFKL
jgi:hypothetical protein